MHRSARNSATTRVLLEQVQDRATGKLAIGAGDVEVAVYLLGGELVAAVAADDDRQLLRMAGMREILADDRVQQLEAVIDEGHDLFGVLLEEASSAALDDLLRERFHQNLCEFVSTDSEPSVVPQKGVFVENIQMGHDTAALIDEVCALCDDAHALDLDALLLRGEADAGRDPMAAVVAEELDRTTPRTVSSLLHELPLEPFRARALLKEMVDSGIAALVDDDEDDVELDDLSPQAIDTADLVALDDLPPMPDESELEVIEPVQQLPDAQEPVVDGDVDLEPTEAEMIVAIHDEPPSEEVQVEPDTADAEPESADQLQIEPATLDDDDLEDEPTQQVARPTVLDDEDLTATPAPATPDEQGADLSWMGQVADDELDFFSDHDYDRGADDDGAFSTELHNLDKVEFELDHGASEVIEAVEAPAVKYGAPVLSEDEALGKLEVANGVLTAVVKAFDEAEGRGRGRAVVQLLVDGGPSKYAPLLQNLQVSPQGELPDDMVLRNLYNRPSTEHRQLLNGSLVDIIERALSSAADELPDDAFDTVLSTVSGYRQRLGL